MNIYKGSNPSIIEMKFHYNSPVAQMTDGCRHTSAALGFPKSHENNALTSIISTNQSFETPIQGTNDLIVTPTSQAFLQSAYFHGVANPSTEKFEQNFTEYFLGPSITQDSSLCQKLYFFIRFPSKFEKHQNSIAFSHSLIFLTIVDICT